MTKLRILIADDFQPTRRSIAALLADQRRVEIVGESGDGFDAVQQARTLRPDIVLLDVDLPTLNGLEVARRIHQLSASTHIIFISDGSSASAAEEAFRVGASAFILKADVGRRLLSVIHAVARGDNLREHRHIETALEPSTESSLPPENGGFVLNSWKEIADYLGRGVRTAQRWESDLGMPVRRPRAKSRSAVLAMSDELDRWLRSAPIAEDASRPANGKQALLLSPESVQQHHRLRQDCHELLAANRKALAGLIAAVQQLTRSTGVAGQPALCDPGLDVQRSLGAAASADD